MAVILKVAADAATIYLSVKEHIRIIFHKKNHYSDQFGADGVNRFHTNGKQAHH